MGSGLADHSQLYASWIIYTRLEASSRQATNLNKRLPEQCVICRDVPKYAERTCSCTSSTVCPRSISPAHVCDNRILLPAPSFEASKCEVLGAARDPLGWCFGRVALIDKKSWQRVRTRIFVLFNSPDSPFEVSSLLFWDLMAPLLESIAHTSQQTVPSQVPRESLLESLDVDSEMEDQDQLQHVHVTLAAIFSRMAECVMARAPAHHRRRAFLVCFVQESASWSRSLS